MKKKKLKKILKEMRKMQDHNIEDFLYILETLDDIKYRIDLIEKILKEPLAELNKRIYKQRENDAKKYWQEKSNNL